MNLSQSLEMNLIFFTPFNENRNSTYWKETESSSENQSQSDNDPPNPKDYISYFFSENLADQLINFLIESKKQTYT